MREIVLDTETTGLSPGAGHRIVEIGCIELVNLVPTGAKRWWYINPEREIPDDAQAVHGITNAMVADKPRFAEIAGELVDFLGDSPLIAHNAGFDLGFLNAELRRAALPVIPAQRAVDTVELARRKFPGAQASLDALCKRFNIDLSKRTQHGALLDAQLLAEVYLQLRGGRQAGLGFELANAAAPVETSATRGPQRPPRPHAPTVEEATAHAALLASLKAPLWLQ